MPRVLILVAHVAIYTVYTGMEMRLLATHVYNSSTCVYILIWIDGLPRVLIIVAHVQYTLIWIASGEMACHAVTCL